jgi:hypothetical protein
MSVTIVSVNLKTESGDSYLYTYDNVEGPEEFVELAEKDLGEELEYVYDFDINVMYSRHEHEDFVQALWKRISEMGDE